MIRDELEGDRAEIREVITAAFGGVVEADLVDALRDGGFLIALQVAVEERIVGMVAFSELPIRTATGVLRGAALAPLAVRPEAQNAGRGSALVRQGLERCRAAGVEVVVVVGAPEYYERFGFSVKKGALLQSPYSGPHSLALELRAGALDRTTGTVEYALPFAGL